MFSTHFPFISMTHKLEQWHFSVDLEVPGVSNIKMSASNKYFYHWVFDVSSIFGRFQSIWKMAVAVGHPVPSILPRLLHSLRNTSPNCSIIPPFPSPIFPVVGYLSTYKHGNLGAVFHLAVQPNLLSTDQHGFLRRLTGGWHYYHIILKYHHHQYMVEMWMIYFLWITTATNIR